MKVEGTQIRSLRLSRGWTQEELAAKACVSVRTLCGAESNRRKPHGGVVNAIAYALGVRAIDLCEQPTDWHAKCQELARENSELRARLAQLEGTVHAG
jgi:transcriptional regulator with XRE-family HTH domain